ncbi:MAG: hypothetical protein PF572_04480 [Patescibacteria group bacterium]|jgi:hypothetical protein|nr:hypothetical protein [Patescibacteria group bacterium]
MNLFRWSENQIRKFNIWDFVVFKIYLFSLGAIVGAYFSQFVIDYVWDFTFVVIASLMWLLYRMFR